MIRNRNADPTLFSAGWMPIVINFSAGASEVAVVKGGARVPVAGKILSAHVHAATITDADDSVRVDLFKNGASILSATVDPVAADTTTSLAGAAGVTVAAGDILKPVITTGAGDALVGAITVVIRPLMGRESGAL